MKKDKQYVGLDVHKDTISMAVAQGGPGMKIRDQGQVAHDVPRVVKKIAALGPASSLLVAY